MRSMLASLGPALDTTAMMRVLASLGPALDTTAMMRSVLAEPYAARGRASQARLPTTG